MGPEVLGFLQASVIKEEKRKSYWNTWLKLNDSSCFRDPLLIKVIILCTLQSFVATFISIAKSIL